MTNNQREAVADYLTEIGCVLDVRAKSDGRDTSRKWFTGAIFQRFVKGGADENVGGLKRNTERIVDIIFYHHPVSEPEVTPATEPATEPAAARTGAPANAQQKPRGNASRAPRARSYKRGGGFSSQQ